VKKGFLIIIFLLFLFGCSQQKIEYNPSLSLGETSIIRNYFEKAGFRDDLPGEEYKKFAAIYPFGRESKGDTTIYYLWVLGESYSITNGHFQPEGGMSVPVKLTMKKDRVVKVEVPGDGNLYVKDINRLFPKKIAREIFRAYDTGVVKKLIEENHRRAQEYFQRKNSNFVPEKYFKLNLKDIEKSNFIELGYADSQKIITKDLEKLILAYNKASWTLGIPGEADFEVFLKLKDNTEIVFWKQQNLNKAFVAIQRGGFRNLYFTTDKEFIKTLESMAEKYL